MTDITLALGGGGARGLAHLGVIEILEQAGYRIRRVVGISIGALVAGLVGFEADTSRVQRRAIQYLMSREFQRHQRTLFGSPSAAHDTAAHGLFAWFAQVQQYLAANRLFHRVIAQPSMLPGVLLHDVVTRLLPDAVLQDARFPLAIVAADLASGHVVVLEKGSLHAAVKGSASLAGIFPPVPWGDMQLVDCGNFYSLPSSIAAAYGGSPVVAVEVSADVKHLPKCRTAIDALVRIDEIGENFWRKQTRESARFVIRPEVHDTQWFDFSRADHLIEKGRRAARAALPELDRVLQHRRN